MDDEIMFPEEIREHCLKTIKKWQRTRKEKRMNMMQMIMNMLESSYKSGHGIGTTETTRSLGSKMTTEFSKNLKRNTAIIQRREYLDGYMKGYKEGIYDSQKIENKGSNLNMQCMNCKKPSQKCFCINRQFNF